jgi:predicted dienelactone hydrolase
MEHHPSSPRRPDNAHGKGPFVLLRPVLCLLFGPALLMALSCTRRADAPALPEPTGPFGVGTERFSFVDSTRPETFTPEPGDFREVAFRVWYPAPKTPCKTRVPYMEKAEERRRMLPEGSPVPAGFFDVLGHWMSNSCYDAVLSDEVAAFPIVLYSHATGAGMDASTVLMEELASHGYVAVSVGHALETSHFVRADGSLRVFPLDTPELRARGMERVATADLQRRLNETADPDELRELVRTIGNARPKTMESLHIWVEDISSVIDRLERMNAEGRFRGRLDLDRIGVVGHSFGGTAAGQACLDEPRCRAGVNLDGLQLGDMLDRPVARPFLFVHHDNAGAVNKLVNLPFFLQAEGPCFMVMVRGTRHLNFSDVSLPGFSGAVGLPAGTLGPIDGLRALAVMNDLVRSFFDRYLRGLPAPLLDDPAAAYPELEMRVRTP